MQDAQHLDFAVQLAVKQQIHRIGMRREKADACIACGAEARTDTQTRMQGEAFGSVQDGLAHGLRSHRVILSDVAGDIFEVVNRQRIEDDSIHACFWRSSDIGTHRPGC